MASRVDVTFHTDAHPLYATFMSRLSACIFEWDGDDLNKLKLAKSKQLEMEGLNPTEKKIEDRTDRTELAEHCRRRTRGVEQTKDLIIKLLNAMKTTTDACGVLLFETDRMKAIWLTQKKHILCIQDPPYVPLYTKVGSLMKGGVELDVFRCGLGSTSLESFHLHLNRFIPGTSANALHFQMYLLDGLARWNADREVASLASVHSSVKSYDVRLKNAVEKLSMTVLGTKQFKEFHRPGKYARVFFLQLIFMLLPVSHFFFNYN